MKALHIMTVAALFGALSAGAAQARLDISYLEKFTATGETQKCVKLRNIHETLVLDNQTIIFRLVSGDELVNRLPHRCVGLRQRGTISYNTLSNVDLCEVDTIRADFESGGRTCFLGAFEKLEKKDQDSAQAN